jgi:hypothetical protein
MSEDGQNMTKIVEYTKCKKVVVADQWHTQNFFFFVVGWGPTNSVQD